VLVRVFVVSGWTDPEGSRPWLGALLLAYYDPDNRLIYAGRAGTGIDHAELERLWRRLQPWTFMYHGSAKNVRAAFSVGADR